MRCARCDSEFFASVGRTNAAAKIGAPLYCGKACAGLARRKPKAQEQKRAEKAEYDRNRRNDIEAAQRRKAQRKAYYQANRERLLAEMAEYRKVRMPAHVEYCRRPEYKAKKHEYDKKRNEQEYADFAEAWRLLLEVEKEIRSQASAYERRVANGYYTRNAQKRRRELWQARKNSMQAT